MTTTKYFVTCLLLITSTLAFADTPSPTTLLTPKNDIADSTPTYTWNAVSDASWYRLWVIDSTDNQKNIWYSAGDAGCSSGSGTCSIDQITVLPNGTGRWAIQTWNNSGYGNWSNANKFKIIENPMPPSATTLIVPEGDIATNTPTYSWEAVSNASWYILWVNDSSNTSTYSWYSAEQANCNSRTCAITPVISLPNGNSAWSVLTWNSFGYGDWSPLKSISVTAPNTPCITRETLKMKIENNDDVTQVNTSCITDMSNLFFQEFRFNQDISAWDVSNVTNMRGMFFWASDFNQNIDGWDVSNVTDMSYMFGNYEGENKFNQNISSWDVSNVTNMRKMFSHTYGRGHFNQDISAWNVSNVTDMSEMFRGATAYTNQDLSAWNVSKVSNHNDFLYEAGSGNIEPNW
jgi:surface protein